MNQTQDTKDGPPPLCWQQPRAQHTVENPCACVTNEPPSSLLRQSSHLATDMGTADRILEKMRFMTPQFPNMTVEFKSAEKSSTFEGEALPNFSLVVEPRWCLQVSRLIFKNILKDDFSANISCIPHPQSLNL